MQDLTNLSDKLVRVQAYLRGYLVRKEHTIAPPKGHFDQSIKIEDWLHNEIVNEIRAKEGPVELEKLGNNTSLGPLGYN